MSLTPAPKHIRDQFKAELERIIPKPIVCLPLMTKPTRDVDKTPKYLPEVWMPPCR